MNDFLKHIADWRDKSDEQCIEMATNEYGVDAEQALMNILECTLIKDIYMITGNGQLFTFLISI